MTDLLFDTPQTLSPYKKWERRNRIKTHYAVHCGDESWCACQTIKRCEDQVASNGDEFCAFGDSRDDAVNRLVEKLGIEPYGLAMMKGKQ